MANYNNHKRNFWCEACKKRVGHFHALRCKFASMFWKTYGREPVIKKIPKHLGG